MILNTDINIKGKNVLVKCEDVYDYMIATIKATQLGGTVMIEPIGDKLTKVDVVISDNNNVKGYEDATIMAIESFKELETITNTDGNIVTIEGFNVDLKNIVECANFCTQVLKVSMDSVKILNTSKRFISNLTWLIPTVVGNIPEVVYNLKDLNGVKTIIIPITEIANLVECGNIKNVTVLSYGEESMLYDSYIESLRDLNIRWFNLYGFPYVNWVSASKKYTKLGNTNFCHEIKPIKGVQLSVKTPDGLICPNNVEGYIYQSTNGTAWSQTVFNGMVKGDGTLIATGRHDDLFRKHGELLHSNTYERVITQMPNILDCVSHEDTIYYVTKNPTSSYEVENFLKGQLDEVYFPIRLVEVPHIIRNSDGSPNISAINSKYTLDSTAINGFNTKASNINVEAVAISTFENAEKSLTLPELPTSILHDNTQTKLNGELKEAFLDGGDFHDELIKYRDLCELFKERSTSQQKIIYYEKDDVVTQTYEQLYQRSVRVASGLIEKGFRPKDVLIFQIEKNQYYLEAYWACTLCGIVPAPIGIFDDYGADNVNVDKLKSIYNLLGQPKVLISESLENTFSKLNNVQGFEGLETITVESCYSNKELDDANVYHWDLDEPSILLFTSGSTGIPKGVQLSHRNIFGRTIGEIERYHFDSTLVDVNWMTLTHAAGLIWTHIRDLYLNSFQVQVDSQVILNRPLMLLDLLSKYKANTTWSPNFAYALIANEIERSNNGETYSWDLSHLTNAYATAEANVSRVLRKFLMVLKPYGIREDAIKPAFGMTETSSVMAYYDTFSLSSTSDVDAFVPIGSPQLGTKFRVVSEDGTLCKEGEVGSLQGQGVTFTQGYYQNPTANASTFTDDGFMITGDLGYIHSGIVTLVGREKEIIILNGLNYYVQDFESVVDDVEGVHSSYSVATSIQGQDGLEKVLILYVPEDESILNYESIAEMRTLNSKVRDAVRKKCRINPDYVIPISSKGSARTDIGKKNRRKYREEFLSGTYNETLFRLQGLESDEYYVLRESLDAIELSDVIIPRYYLCNDVNVLPNIKDSIINVDEVTTLIDASIFVDTIVLENVHTTPIALMELLLVRSKVWSQLPKSSTVIVPTLYSHPMFKDITFNESGAILRGFVETFCIENLDVNLINVDCDSKSLEKLASGIAIKKGQHYMVYRDDKCYVPSLSSYRELPSSNTPLKEHQTVLVLGGLGGIGFKVCESLLKSYDDNLIILGSSPLETKLDAFNELAKLSKNVTYYQVDISNASMVESVVSQAEEKFNSKVEVMFNLAGKLSASQDGKDHWSSINEHYIAHETLYSAQQVAISKVDSMHTLQSLRNTRNDATLIVFGSVNSMFGGSGLVSYSSFCSCQEAICKYLQIDFPNTYYISWGQWDSIGLSANMPENIRKMSQSGKFLTVSSSVALKYMFYVLNHNICDAILGVNRTHNEVRYIVKDNYNTNLQIFYTQADNLQDVNNLAVECFGDTVVHNHLVPNIVRKSNNPLDVDSASMLRLCKSKGETEPLTEDEKKMAKLWEEVLGISNIGANDDFFDCGGSSVLTSTLGFKIQQEFGTEITFTDIIEHSTVRSLSAYRLSYQSRQVPQDDTFISEKMERDSHIGFPIVEYLAKANPISEIKTALLTGATGFLGAFVLTELLNKTDYNVVVLIRADNQKHALERLNKNMDFYHRTWDSSRVRVVVGDIAKSRLGLSQKDYTNLAKEVDTIYHVGAIVNFVASYDALAPSNIEGTRRLLRFASMEKVKLFNFVSSIAILDGITPENGIISEDVELKESSPNLNNYNRSKWVSDCMVQEAKALGLPCKIYRIGTIIGDTQYGKCQLKDFVWLLIKSFTKIHLVPKVDGFAYNPVPADILAEGIVGLSLTDWTGEKYKYFLSYDSVNLDTIVKWVSNFCSPLKMVTYTEWKDALVEYSENNNDSSMLSILGALPSAEVMEGANYCKLDDSTTKSIMEQYGMTTTGTDETVFMKTYEHLKQMRFFD